MWVSWVEWYPPKGPSEPVNVTLFGERVFADLIKDLKMGSCWVEWAPNPMTNVL